VGQNIFGLIGASSQALEILDFAPKDSVRFLLSSSEAEIGQTFSRIPIYDLTTTDPELTEYGVVPAVGAPALKRELISQWAGPLCPAVVASTAYVSINSTQGDGTVVAPNTVLMTNTRIGKCVLINAGATVSHDTVIGDFSTISPGVNIGGNCSISEGVFLGIGATVIQGIFIAPGTYVGAGAVVTQDITIPGTYVGVPAKMISSENVWALKL
jgi:sugar O-acyltransferase (sialic acid O-acetyltransferase NeuD family)